VGHALGAGDDDRVVEARGDGHEADAQGRAARPAAGLGREGLHVLEPGRVGQQHAKMLLMRKHAAIPTGWSVWSRMMNGSDHASPEHVADVQRRHGVGRDPGRGERPPDRAGAHPVERCRRLAHRMSRPPLILHGLKKYQQTCDRVTGTTPAPVPGESERLEE
jgi:hypothetical protein